MSRSVGYHVVHETRYHYGSTVSLSQQLTHVSPRSFDFQQVLHHSLEVGPPPAEHDTREDYFGNPILCLAVRQAHDTLLLRAASTVEVFARPGSWREAGGASVGRLAGELRRFPSQLPIEPQQFIYASPQVPLLPALRDYAARIVRPEQGVLAAARALTHRIHTDFTFDPEATTVATPLTEVLAHRRGVCQDFAHLMIGCLRSLGLAARYVSGYLLTRPPPGRPRLLGADASHAWVSVWEPELGWVDFDPTNGCQPELEHVVLGWGRDFLDVTPMRGVILGGGAHEVEVEVTVMPSAGLSLDELLQRLRQRQVPAGSD